MTHGVASVCVSACVSGKEQRDPISNSVQRQTDISVEDVASLWTIMKLQARLMCICKEYHHH